MKKITMIILITFISSSSFAGVLIEPYLGYGITGSSDSSGSKGSASGPFYGARLGYKTLGLSIAGEYEMVAITTENDLTKDKTDLDVSNLGLYVAYELPVLFRVFASYSFSSSAEVDSTNTYLKGSGTKIGIGYTGLPFVSIDLTYASFSYDKLELATGTEVNADSDASLIGIGLSIPFDL